MRRIASAITLSGLAAMLVLSAPGHSEAQMRSQARPSPKATVSQTLGTTTITVTYSRPGVKGRTIFGDLVPWGEVWRAGANEATAVEFSADVKVNGQDLAAGKYGLWVIPGRDGAWTVIFSSNAEVWGLPYDDSGDVLRVTTQAREAPAETEWLTYSFMNLMPEVPTAGELVLSWAGLQVPIMVDASGM